MRERFREKEESHRHQAELIRSALPAGKTLTSPDESAAEIGQALPPPAPARRSTRGPTTLTPKHRVQPKKSSPNDSRDIQQKKRQEVVDRHPEDRQNGTGHKNMRRKPVLPL